MILLWGLEADTPIALVRKRLDERGQPYVFLNQADVLDVTIDIRYEPRPIGWLAVDGTRYDLGAFSAVYLRPYDFRQFPEFADRSANSTEWKHAIGVEDMLCGYADVAPTLVVNRPSTMLANNSKPYQCSLASEFGFHIPRTLLTTDEDAVREFRRSCGAIVYKSISGQRSIVKRLADEDDGRLADVRWCPTQFQEAVPGDDYRVHVVGREVFATRVRSSDADYRYGAAVYEPTVVPEDISTRCVAASARMGLHLAGVDLRRTPHGDWYCFEINPCPAYSCYEIAADQAISDAIADMLCLRTAA